MYDSFLLFDMVKITSPDPPMPCAMFAFGPLSALIDRVICSLKFLILVLYMESVGIQIMSSLLSRFVGLSRTEKMLSRARVAGTIWKLGAWMYSNFGIVDCMHMNISTFTLDV